MLVLIILADISFMRTGSLLDKSIASLMFVAVGLVNLIYLLKVKRVKRISTYIMFVGLCFACLGDVFLEIEFIIGAGLFALGHVFYFISYCGMIKLRWKDLLFSLLIAIPSLLLILCAPIFDFGANIMKIVCCVYAIIISFMVGKAVSNLVEKRSVLNLIVLIGSVLFFFSDLMLLFNIFADVGTMFGALCLLTYYPAEFLLAYSILKHNKE